MRLISANAIALLAALAAVCLVPIGHASNLRFLESAPASNFDDRDWALLRQAVGELLDGGHDGDTGAWQNAENGHNGKLVLMKSYGKYGTTCRTLKITNEAGDFRATSLRDFCKDKTGEWKVLK